MSSVLAAVDWPVRSKRLIIRPAAEADVESMWQFRRLDSVTHWMPTTWSDKARFLKDLKEPERLAKTLVMVRDDGVIGDLMLAVEDGWAQAEVADRAKGVHAEIGWCLDPAYEGNGYATEGVAELIRICFEELDLRRVTAYCFADNEASWRLMERVGMRCEAHTVRDSLHRSDGWLDGLGYALLADEWRDRR